MTKIHPTAIVSEKAEIGSNVEIGPYTIVDDDVVIGNDVEIQSHVLITNGARIGNSCKIFKGVVVANTPQDLKFDGKPTLAIIKDNSTIREFVTIHRGTHATGKTTVGSNCLIMAYSHIAHDCLLGDNVIMANSTQLAGHVHVEDYVIFGGATLVHQFSFVGCHSMIQGGSKITKDVPPYTLIGKEPPKVEGLNKIGLKRRGFTDLEIQSIEDFYQIILHSGFNVSQGISEYLKDTPEPIDKVQHCIEFIKQSQRGIFR
jgi:UDP-N-acetylglucosamine acyltransferase